MMEISTLLCAILLCINFIVSDAHTTIRENDNDLLVITKEKTSNNTFSKDLLKLKDLEKALEEFLTSNDDLAETINAGLPESAKLLADNEMNDTDYVDWNITREELVRDSGDLFRTLTPNIKDQIGNKLNIDDGASFADLFTSKSVFDDDGLTDFNLIESKTKFDGNDRTKRDDHTITKNKSKDRDDEIVKPVDNNILTKVKFLNSSAEPDLETSTPSNNEVEKLIKLLKEEEKNDYDGLEEIFDEEEPKESSYKAPSYIQSTLRGLPARFILPILNARSKASSAVNASYQSVRNVTGGIVKFLNYLG